MPTDSFVTRLRSVLPVAAVLLVGAALTFNWLSAKADNAPLAGGSGGPAPSAKPIPDELFKGWPAGRKPDLAIVLTGQQHGYLKFCGCSTPQLGGFERRYNFIAKLRERGWPIVAVDLGDLVTHQTRGLDAQMLLKYETAMNSLEAIGYAAVGIGENEYKFKLWDVLARFALQKPDAYPRTVAANLADKVAQFPHPLDGKRSMVRDWVTTDGAGVPRVGVVSVASRKVTDAVVKHDPTIAFDDNAKVLTNALAKLDEENVELKVLLYHGDFDHAGMIAGDPKLLAKLPENVKAGITTFPDKFDIILCLSAEEQPPSRPDIVGKTMIVRIGHRGLHVGVVGVFKTGNPKRPFELHYQYAQMGEEYETDKAKEADHRILKILDTYAKEVKNQNFLGNTPQAPHPVKQMLPQANVRYAGSGACAACHQSDYAIWMKTKHSHAYEALTKKAEKPRLRQYDPECVVCHTVGFGYQTGYTDEAKTKHLLHVGCENCHGPAGHHAADPKNRNYYAQLSPWKSHPAELLPTQQAIKVGIGAMPPAQQAIMLRVDGMCQKCHDIDNDPHFKFEKYWPVIAHGKNGPPTLDKVQR